VAEGRVAINIGATVGAAEKPGTVRQTCGFKGSNAML